MSHSYSRRFFHVVWSTKYRMPLLSESAKKKTYQVIHGLVEKEGSRLIAVGGTYDHIHLLLKLKRGYELEKLIRIVKTKSSKFINKNNKNQEFFAWQIGYSDFTVSYSFVDKITRYINNQEEHHKTASFEDEIEFLLEL